MLALQRRVLGWRAWNRDGNVATGTDGIEGEQDDVRGGAGGAGEGEGAGATGHAAGGNAGRDLGFEAMNRYPNFFGVAPRAGVGVGIPSSRD